MRSVSVANIIVRVRRWVSAAGDTVFLPDAEVVDYVNEEYPRIYALYAKAFPELFRTEVDVTSTGVATYPLPADYFETIGVDWKQSATSAFRLRRLMESERNRYSGVTSGPARAYRPLGNTLALFPTPRIGDVYRHIYIPTAPTYTSGDSIDGILGHEKLLELAIALRILAGKDEVDFSQTASLYKECKDDVQEEASMRAAEAVYPTDEWDEYDRDYGSFRDSPP
jgi:hypothetical protein